MSAKARDFLMFVGQVKVLRKQGRSQRYIAALLKKSRGSVRHALKAKSRISRRGHHLRLSSRQRRVLIRTMRDMRTAGSRKLCKEAFGRLVSISPSTVRRYLNRAGYRYVRVAKKPLLSYLNQLRQK